MKKLAIVHTTPATITGLRGMTDGLLPDVRIFNFMDDSIISEINENEGVTPGARYRFSSLMATAASLKPDAILCACSTVGELAEDCRQILTVPVFRIDEPMAETAARRGGKCAVLATVFSTVGPTCRLIERKAAEFGINIECVPHVIEGAGKLLGEGKFEEYRMLLAEKFTEKARECDNIVLAQASMAAALANVAEEYRDKFMTSPATGVRAVKDYLDTL